ncbi:hypothetical protein LCGC14_1938360 [marine sediment metagenome]|uniref:Uncharacterized protein n=1 Tax=marine sediment metagenome TaxID=412755 RepID=A0A0F9G9H1_9ZZZZ
MNKHPICECEDGECLVCSGKCGAYSTTLLRRVDTDDQTGIRFCDDCVEDAIAAGVYAVFQGDN